MEDNSEIILFGRPAKQGRWGFVFLGFFINLFMGSNFSWSIFRKPLESAFQIGSTLSGLPYTLFFACFVSNMLISSRFFAQRYSPKIVFITGTFLIGIGWIASSFGTNIGWITVTYGFIAGSGAGIAYGVPIAVTSRWFPGKTGLALGLTLAGYGLSPVLVAPAANALITLYGFQTAFLVIGTAAFFCLLLCSIPLRFPPEEFTKRYAAKHHDTHDNIETKLTPSLLKTERRFQGLYFGYFIAALSGPMAIGIASPAGQELIGLSAASAAAFLPLFAVSNGFGRTMFGWLSDAITPPYASAISFFLILLACIGMALAGTGDLFIFLISFCFFWMTMGGWIAMAPSITSSFFGRRHQTENYGLVFTAYGFGGIIGILLSGAIKDLLGSYRMVFYPMGVLAIIGIFVSFAMSRRSTAKGTKAA